SPAADRLAHGPSDLRPVQVIRGQSFRRLIFPSIRGMATFEQLSLVDSLRHNDGCRTVAHVGPSVVGEGPTAAGHAQGNDAGAGVESHCFDVGEYRWFDPPQFVVDLF